MALPDQLLLSDLLQHTVRCELGLDHGPGIAAWMHPPVHRLLGWVSRPSALRMTREVWRLNQCLGFTDQQVYVRGEPAVTDQTTLDRLPSLLDAELLNCQGEKIGRLVDLTFKPDSGRVLHYVVTRSDPRLPGGSRWRLMPDRIDHQEYGCVTSALNSLDELPLIRSSVRQDLLLRTQRWRDQLREMGDRAGDRLEGWLDQTTTDSEQPEHPPRDEIWDDDRWDASSARQRSRQDHDPWV